MNSINIEFLKNIDLQKFIDSIVPIINILSPIKYSPNAKYDNRYFITCILDLTINGVYWSRYTSSIPSPIEGKSCIKGKYLNEIHHKYIKNGVYDAINKQLLSRYLKNGREEKLKYQVMDTSYVANKVGS